MKWSFSTLIFPTLGDVLKKLQRGPATSKTCPLRNLEKSVQLCLEGLNCENLFPLYYVLLVPFMLCYCALGSNSVPGTTPRRLKIENKLKFGCRRGLTLILASMVG